MSPNVTVTATLPVPGVIGATFKGNYMYATSTQGVHVFDISNPALPVPAGALPLPHFENEDVSLAGNTLLIGADWFVGGRTLSVVHVIDISIPTVPVLKNTVRPLFDAHIASCVPPDCRFGYITGSQGVAILDTVTGTVHHDPLNRRGAFANEIGGTHDVNFDSAGVAWVVGGNGTAGYDISDPLAPVRIAMTDATGETGPLNDFIHHNSQRPDVAPGVPGNVVLITEEDYVSPMCNGAGFFETWEMGADGVLRNLDTWDTKEGGALPAPDERPALTTCSSHWFDERDGLVAVGWYEQGTRILDVRDPTNIRQVGYYVPTANVTWGAYWAPNDPSVIYSVDFAHGIDVLRVDRAATTSTQLAPYMPVPTSSATTRPSPEFGWACRLPA